MSDWPASEDVPSQSVGACELCESPQYPNFSVERPGWLGSNTVLTPGDNCTPPTHHTTIPTVKHEDRKSEKLQFIILASSPGTGKSNRLVAPGIALVVLLTRHKFHHKVSPDSAEGKRRVHRPLKGTARRNKDIVRAQSSALQLAGGAESGVTSLTAPAPPSVSVIVKIQS